MEQIPRPLEKDSDEEVDSLQREGKGNQQIDREKKSKSDDSKLRQRWERRKHRDVQMKQDFICRKSRLTQGRAEPNDPRDRFERTNQGKTA